MARKTNKQLFKLNIGIKGFKDKDYFAHAKVKEGAVKIFASRILKIDKVNPQIIDHVKKQDEIRNKVVFWTNEEEKRWKSNNNRKEDKVDLKNLNGLLTEIILILGK